ncbi:hypothetical protein FQV27_06805 [Paracoccus aurantiacus]|uniref:Uncharacterized protein n=1 Tax=Paracoccus aurantiacus TaxID=2599412 RepID=A0A5C6S7V1_9RHOB|nr:hypothetical protein [Paracoccus aurantiacus]TXB69822.1 hypothetical protein FQV27_06805 [Paracoccus aurantiacus]
MQRLATLLMSIMALAFVASGMKFALTPAPEVVLPLHFTTEQMDPDGLAEIYLRPQHPAMWIMLGALWVLMLRMALREAMPDGNRPALDMTDLLLIISALALGTIWPWISVGAPLVGFMLCVLMLLALIATGRRTDSEGRLARDPTLGVFAGWATVLTFAAFASFLSDATPIPMELATLAGAILSCSAAIAVQLRIPRNPAYTITVMYALLATAATTIEVNPPVAVIAVLSMAALTFLLVRVTT